MLEDVTLDIKAGETLAVLGPNGSGKTAFLKTLAGILPPLQGAIGRPSDQKGKSTRVGYVPQRAAVSGLLPLTVGEVIQMGTYGTLKPWQPIGSQEREQIRWAAQQVGIEPLEKKLYSELSGGQQQRVLIARALASAPSVLVLDEPLASLDQNTVQTMLRLLDKLKAEPGLLLLWADHFVPELLKIVQEVLILEDRHVLRTSVSDCLQRVRGNVKAISPSAYE